jgi:hypothetical protein
MENVNHSVSVFVDGNLSRRVIPLKAVFAPALAVWVRFNWIPAVSLSERQSGVSILEEKCK